MRKVLLSLCASILALSASADVTTFMMEGAPKCRYPGTGNIVEIPHGFVFTYQANDALCRSAKTLNKAMVASNVMIEADRLRKDPANPGLGFVAETTTPYSYTRCGQLFWYPKNVCKITPAAGTAVTKIVMHAMKDAGNTPFKIVTVENGALVIKDEFIKNAADTTQTWTGNFTEPFHILHLKGTAKETDANSPMWIEVTTEGTSTQVEIPACSKKIPMVGKSEKIELTCPTEGAQIYYIVDYDYTTSLNTVDISKATLYTGPFTLEKDAVIRAIAVKDGMTNSFPIYQEYAVVDDYTKMVEFNFNDHTTLRNVDGNLIANYATYPVANGGSTEGIDLLPNPIFNDEAMFSVGEKGGKLTLSNSFSGVVELRPTKGADTEFGVTAPIDYYISSMLVVTGYTAGGLVIADNVPGTFEVSPVNAARKIYRNTDKDSFYAGVKTAPRAGTTTYDQQYIDHLYVFLKYTGESGIDGIEIDETNAPVEYFNLQGVRVANPTNGIYIKRQGSKATKIMIK